MASTELSAGVSGVDITPRRPTTLQGYSSRDGLATDVCDRLAGRAIVLNDGTTSTSIVSADLIGLDGTSVQRIRKLAEDRCDVPGRNVMIACSHTHSGPAVQRMAGSPPNEEYLEWVEGKLADAIVTASRVMRPVRLSAGHAHADFNVNRRKRTPDGVVMRPNPAGDVDNRVQVLRIDPVAAHRAPSTPRSRTPHQTDPLAVVFMYPCHATSLMADNTLYSADFPGAARRFLESVYCNGTLAVYLPGCSGDLRPNLVAPDGRFRSATGHELTVFGRLLGAAVIQAAESAVPSSSGALASTTRSVSLPFDHVPDEQELLAVTGHSTHGVWARELLEQLKKHGVLPAYADAEIQIMRLGRHWIIATSGETMLGIGRAIEQGLGDLGLAAPDQGDHTMVLGYTNGNAGYFCTSSSFFEGGYEPRTSFDYYLHPGPFSPKIETTLVNTALELALELDLPPQLE